MVSPMVGVEQKVQECLQLHLSELDRKGELQRLVKDEICIRVKLVMVLKLGEAFT